MVISCRAGIISLVIKKVIKRYYKLQTHLNSKFRLQTLHFNPQESHVRNFICNNRLKKSGAIKKGTILNTFSTMRDIIDV